VKIVRGPVENVASLGVEPEVIGGAVAHIASNVSNYISGETIQLQNVAREIGLL